MKVILLEELKGKGGEGDVVEVSTGFAVNFLFPKKIAVLATSGNLKQLEQRKHNIAKREADRLDTADKLVEALEGKTIRIGAKVGEEGQLFGSVTAIQVADAINERFNTNVDRKRIDLHGAIKTVGEHVATISIYRDVKANITIEVVDERALRAAEEESVEEVAAEAEAEVVAEAGTEAGTEAVAEAEVEIIAEAETVAEPEGNAEAEDTPVAEAEVDENAVIEKIEDAIGDAARTLAQVADAAEGEDAAVADAAVEVLQEIEEAVEIAVADAAVSDTDAEEAE
jgi:large subunit ribosomal protein L9